MQGRRGPDRGEHLTVMRRANSLVARSAAAMPPPSYLDHATLASLEMLAVPAWWARGRRVRLVGLPAAGLVSSDFLASDSEVATERLLVKPASFLVLPDLQHLQFVP